MPGIEARQASLDGLICAAKSTNDCGRPRAIRTRVSAVCVANLNNPEISGHSDRTFWQNYNLGGYNLSSYLASLVQKGFVASLQGERWAARQSSLLKSASCRSGRRFRIFLFRTSQSLHHRGSQKEYLTVGHLVRGRLTVSREFAD